jgi:hypothetical protein
MVVTRGFAIPPAEDHLQGELFFTESHHCLRATRRATWLRPKQTNLVPDKGQFRSRF